MTTFHPPAEIAICYHGGIANAGALARRLGEQVEAAGAAARVRVMPDPLDPVECAEFGAWLGKPGLVVCVGGDGTVLHASEFAAIAGTPIFGVRMGRLGFLTETIEAEAADALAIVLRGEARLERHAMVQASVGGGEPVHALNDIVIGRAVIGRTISVAARMDGVLLAEYRADALIVATATGSTGYALSVGGPILPPTSPEIIVVPVAPHLTQANPLVLPADVSLRLFVERGYDAVVTPDGLHQQQVDSGTVIEVKHSDRYVDFVRLGGPEQFYANVARRLGWLRADHALDGLPEAPSGRF